MGCPDMRIPIQYAISYPYRLNLNSTRLDFAALKEMTFFKPDTNRFPFLAIAYDALDKGGNATCAMNAANEIAVAAFLQEKIKFGAIPQIIEKTMSKCCFIANPTIEDIYQTNDEAIAIARELLPK